MSLNQTPRSERVHIAIFGKTNAGKSSLINAITNQEIALVSSVKGTTTDPVYKSMELPPIGPVVIIDTAGLDDFGELGELRKKKTFEVLDKTDIAVIVIDGEELRGVTDMSSDGENDSADNSEFTLEINFERLLIDQIKEKKIPIVGAINKIDAMKITDEETRKLEEKLRINLRKVSAISKEGIDDLKEDIIKALPEDEEKFKLVGDLVSPGDFVVLVVPIDKAAPKGRLILPQQQVIRDILESDATAIVVKEHELKDTLDNIGKTPRMVITDSQVFLKVSADTPKNISLTSFSILFARNKGELTELVRGAKAVDNLKDGDKILISEACTHHRQADDIGKVKIPRWLRQMTGKKLEFEFSSGMSFADDIKKYALIVHCGGCMLNNKAMKHRINQAVSADVPIVNYGVLIAYIQGVLERAITPFPLAKMVWDEG